MNKILIDSKKVQLDIGIQNPDGTVGGSGNCIVVNTQDCTFQYTLKDNLIEYRLSFKTLTEDDIDIVSELKEFLHLEEIHYCTQESTQVLYSIYLTWENEDNLCFTNQFLNCTVTDWDIQDDFVVISGQTLSQVYDKAEYDSEGYHSWLIPFYEQS